MGRFNAKTDTDAKTVNAAGGRAYKIDPRFELVSLLTTSFLNNKGYEKDSEQLKRLELLVKIVDPLFAAKAAIYARKEHGLRSISHAMAAMLGRRASKQPWATSFYDKIVHRPDDAGEIIGALWSLTDTRKGVLSAAMKKGFGRALSRCTEYSLGKYRGESKGVKLVDLTNLTHPKATEGLTKLMKGTLESPDTWEVAISACGSSDEKKAAEWKRLVVDNKLGIFAILRNVNNIVASCGDDKNVMAELVTQLTNAEAIKKSLILPFQFGKAITAVEGKGQANSLVLDALRDALDLSLCSVPQLDGDTVVVLDTSESMGKPVDDASPIAIGALFAATILKSQKGAKFMMFADKGAMKNVSTRSGIWDLRKAILDARVTGGTDFHSIFHEARAHKLDVARMFILSDMQGWMGRNTPQEDAADWAKSHCTIKPTIYSWDLNASSTSQLTQSAALDVVQVAGWSDKVFDMIKLAEEDPADVLAAIEAVQL